MIIIPVTKYIIKDKNYKFVEIECLLRENPLKENVFIKTLG